jgi:hypothetical protein
MGQVSKQFLWAGFQGRHRSQHFNAYVYLGSPQNLALNVADKGFTISVYNRTYEKTEAAVKRAQKEGA